MWTEKARPFVAVFGVALLAIGALSAVLFGLGGYVVSVVVLCLLVLGIALIASAFVLAPASTDKQQDGRSARRWFALLEAVVYLALVVVVNRVVHPEHHGYLYMHPHPFWIVAILIPLRYGFRESVVCALLASAVYAFFVVFPQGGTYTFRLENVFPDFTEPILFLLVAGLFGEHNERTIQRYHALQGRVARKEAEIAQLEEEKNVNLEALRLVESRVVEQMASVLDLVKALAETKKMSPVEIKAHMLQMAQEYTKAEQACYYDVRAGKLVAVTSVGEPDSSTAPASRDMIVREAIRRKDIAYISELLEAQDMPKYRDMSLLAGAVRNRENAVVGVVSVGRMPFLAFNPSSFKLFSTIVDLWGGALAECLQLEELQRSSIFDQELGLYNYSYFLARLAEEFRRARDFSLPLSLTLLHIRDFATVLNDKRRAFLGVLTKIITRNITELDLIARYRHDSTIAIIFPLTMAEDATKKVARITDEIQRFDFHPYRDAGHTASLDAFSANYEIGMQSHEDLIGKAEQGIGERIEA